MAAPDEITLTAGSSYWMPFKELYNTINEVIVRKNAEPIPDLENLLKKYKPAFMKLLKNPGKNTSHRDAVKASCTSTGIKVAGQRNNVVLSSQLVEESLIFSDMFNLNELTSIELLLSGEQQLCQFPGLTRGLVAVLLYYDGRRALVNALRTLLQAREGRAWTLGLSDDLVSLVTSYTDQLIENNLVATLLDQLQKMDLQSETERLFSNRAIGNPKHKKQVLDLMHEAKQSLADCIFCVSCQSNISKVDVMSILEFLARNSSVDQRGRIDKVTLTLLSSILYSIDVSILQTVEDSDECVENLTMVKDRSFIPSFHKEINVSLTKWKIGQMKAVVQFAWAVTLRTISQYPYLQEFGQCIEEDENIVDEAIENDVFSFLRNYVVSIPGFHSEDFFLKRIHSIISSFIILMPLKVKELRNRSDEVARIMMAHAQEGIEPPQNLPAHFNHLLLLIGAIYEKDPLGLELGAEYWYSSDPTSAVSNTPINSTYSYGNPQKQVALFKFVRSSSDLLPPTLYIPYIKMLTSLARTSAHSAHLCYNMLKSNGSNSNGKYSTVSWDHFFSALHRYYDNLHGETALGSDTQHIYRQRQPTKGITPQEMEGVVAVLDLIEIVARLDEPARISLFENKLWVAVGVLLGLAGCTVPPHLKSRLLKTLSAFARTPQIADNIWQGLEASQVVQTKNTTSAYQNGGIRLELEEIECRLEEYPLTRSMLDLLYVLVKNSPSSIRRLGVGLRSPGFDPYLSFVRDSAFLKFDSRVYKDPAEQWDFAKNCLQVLCRLLEDYEPCADDFCDTFAELQGGGSAMANRHPGHNIMLHMMNNGELFKKVLFVVDKATNLLDEFCDFPGKEHLENCALLSLKMIELTLEKQTTFSQLLRQVGSSSMTTPVEKLLLGINPRTGFADHLLNVSKFVTYNAYLPEHSLMAVCILVHTCRSPLIQTQIVDIFKSDRRDLSVDLLQGFVECIDVDDVEVQQHDQHRLSDDEQFSNGRIRNLTRQKILSLLLMTLDQPSPNLAHFLLGFETSKPVCNTNLQDPGILGARQTCLHVILSLLNDELDVTSDAMPSTHGSMPVFVDQSYRLVHKLCTNEETSAPTLRYLRTNHDFFFKHLHKVPFRCSSNQLEKLSLSQQSWFLRSVAVELKVTAANNQRSHVGRLLNLLVDDKPTNIALNDGNYDMDASSVFDRATSGGMSATFGSQITFGGQKRRRLLAILDNLQFHREIPTDAKWKYFDASTLEQVFASCEEKSSILPKVNVIDVQKLHQVLVSELNHIQGAAAMGQRASILEEIESILKYAIRKNESREELVAKKEAFDAWRLITEVVLIACPLDLLDGEKRQNVLFEIIQELLKKVLEDGSLTELTNPVSGVILTLLRNLRMSFGARSKSNGVERSEQRIGVGGWSERRTMSSHSPYSSFLQVTLRGLIECIITTSGSQQKVRANFYAALLSYLQIGETEENLLHDDRNECGDGATSDSMRSGATEDEKLRKQNVEVILGYGSNFMEVVCRDTTGGHDICKLLALATLDAMCSIDVPNHWLNFMNSKGYVGHLVHSIGQDDDALRSVLTVNPPSLRPLFIFESKMALLTRIACTPSGAHSLLHNGTIDVLSDCSSFDMRICHSNRRVLGEEEEDEDLMVPTVYSRYAQILFPALKLCMAFVTSLNNGESGVQVLRFLTAHSRTFHDILSDDGRLDKDDSIALQEKSLLTAILSRTVAFDANLLGDENEGDRRADVKVGASHFEHLMFQLLPRSMDRCRRADPNMRPLHLEILTNVLTYCFKFANRSTATSRLFLAPTFSNSKVSPNYAAKPTISGLSNEPPTLGLVVCHLQECMDAFLKVFDQHKVMRNKLKSIGDLTSDELGELIDECNNLEKMSSQTKKFMATKRLLSFIASKTKEMKLCSNMIETSIFLLWRHLEHYLMVVPATSTAVIGQLPRRSASFAIRRLNESTMTEEVVTNVNRRSTAPSSSMTSEDFVKFKSEVASIGDNLFRKLHAIEQCYIRSHSHGEFMEAILRRIKRLVQLHTI